jgi:predicted component of viral defense system (DUF524 family)
VTANALESVRLGPFLLSAQDSESLWEEGGAIVVLAERSYLLQRVDGSDPFPAHITKSLRGSNEARLFFGNFIGETDIGGLRVLVRSTRLGEKAIEAMLDEVSGEIFTLASGFDTPVSTTYTRAAVLGADVTYQSYAFIRDAMLGRGRHDLRSAVERILFRPNRRFEVRRRTVGVGEVSATDADTFIRMAQRADQLVLIPPDHPVALTPLARALDGRFPLTVDTPVVLETTNTVENRFVAAVIDLAGQVVWRYEAAAARRDSPGIAARLQEARGIATQLQQWRKHTVLADLVSARGIPVQSTVMRGRIGYRELMLFFGELLNRTRGLDPEDARRLIDAREVSLIYEYWSYFVVLRSVERALRREPVVDSVVHGVFGSKLPNGFCARIGDVLVYFNQTYSAGAGSYSVSLRPDITLRLASGELHIFDAKFKRDVLPARDDVDEDGEESAARRGDLYKMHTYRDALDARSVFVLYPGTKTDKYPISPQPAPFEGVGAIALRPGESTEVLDRTIAGIVGLA